VYANQRGSSPSRLIAYRTRVTPSMNVNITVRMPMIAPTAITSASPLSPTEAKAPEKPLSRAAQRVPAPLAAGLRFGLLGRDRLAPQYVGHTGPSRIVRVAAS
jgi:hypothetical protein